MLQTDKIEQPWIKTAWSLIGTVEKPGSANNQKIMNWAKEIGGREGKKYYADSVAWCGLFCAYCFYANKIDPVEGWLWARNWNRFGKKLTEPAFGCVIVFSRAGGGGHVGFYVSEDADTYHVLGGNQGNMVSIKKIAKNRCIGFRWPNGQDAVFSKGKVKRKLAGTISKNEA